MGNGNKEPKDNSTRKGLIVLGAILFALLILHAPPFYSWEENNRFLHDLFHPAVSNSIPAPAPPTTESAPSLPQDPTAFTAMKVAAWSGLVTAAYWVGFGAAMLLVSGAILAFVKWRWWWISGLFLQQCARLTRHFTLRADQFRKTLSYPLGSPELQSAVFDLVEKLYYLEEIQKLPERPGLFLRKITQKEMCQKFRPLFQWASFSPDLRHFYTTVAEQMLDRLVSLFPGDRYSTITCAIADELDPKVLEGLVDLLKNERGYAKRFLGTYHANREDASHKRLTAWEYGRGDRKRISDGDIDPHEFLKKTPFEDFLTTQVPYVIDRRARFEHAVMVVPSGGGKSQTIEALLLQDLDQADPPGIVLIDMKDHIVPQFSRLLEFDTRLRDRLIILRASDKPAFGLFDAESEERLVEQTQFFLATTIQSEVSGTQEAVLTALLRLMHRIPGANLETLRAALANIHAFEDEIRAIPDEGLQTYLLRDFKTSGTQTRDALARRLDQIRNDPVLGPIFGGSKNCVDFAEALNAGKIILVVPSGKHGAVFGQFVLSQVLGAAFARKGVPEERLRDVHVYCDEADPYVSGETVQLFNRVRSFHIGCTFAFQNCDQMREFKNAILSSTAIKIAAGNSHADAATMAREMGKTLVHFIEQHQPPPRALGRPKALRLACWVRGERQGDRNRARTIQVRTGQLERRPKMPPEAHQEILRRNHERLHRAADEQGAGRAPDVAGPTPASPGHGPTTPVEAPPVATGADASTAAPKLGKAAQRRMRREAAFRDPNSGRADASPEP